MRSYKRLSLWIVLCLALCLTAAGCQNKEEPSSQVSSQPVESVSELESNADQQSVSPQSRTASSGVVQEAQEEPSSTLEEEGYAQQEKLAFQDLLSENGGFILPGLAYEMPVEVFLVTEGMSLLTQKEIQQVSTPDGSYTLATYDAGPRTLEDQQFETSVTFQDDLLSSCTLTAQGEDLTALYEALSGQQEALFGVSDSWEIGSTYDEKGNLVSDSSLVTESQEEGGTTLILVAQKLDGKVIQVDVTLSQEQ
jgi:hypothetical protein